MDPTRAPAWDRECALLAGESVCRCVAEAPDLTDAQVCARATAMFRYGQRVPRNLRAIVRAGLDALLAHVRGRRSLALHADVLRSCILLRLVEKDDAGSAALDELVAEFDQLADRSGDPRWLGEAATLRAHRATVLGRPEHALADTAQALALLIELTVRSEYSRPNTSLADVDGDWPRLLARSLNGLLLVLLRLGAHELADEVSLRAIAVADAGTPAIDRLVHQLNRVRLQLSWALRLERGSRDAAAATRFVGAAQTAQRAARLWVPALGLTPGDGRSALRECAVIGAAYALSKPDPRYLDGLLALVPTAHFTEDRISLTIAIARCLLAGGRVHEALAALAPLHHELQGDTTEGNLALALHREYAKVDDLARGRPDHSAALGAYATALESELWAMREARLTALRTHTDRLRLAREHGAVAAQALQDPLTGLPNRRALDLRLAETLSASAAQPCAVALIDLDRFKIVNDARSHAAGDAVLRTIAGCVRTVLRARDMVARYGGDEFVVVMPGTPLAVARAALRRAADAVAALPAEFTLGVTMSIGVVPASMGSTPSAVLAGADAAMYRAKRSGGNTVIIGDEHDTDERASWHADHGPPTTPVARVDIGRVMSSTASTPPT